MKCIGIIPARSGSKGLKDKNIKLLDGKPLIAHTIEAAIQSEQFDTVMVSTDSLEYKCIAERYGAKVPFLRDVENSTDSASSWDAVREVLKKYHNLGMDYDICVLLQPTSPLRTKEDIVESMKLFKSQLADAVVSVCEVAHPVQWCFTLNNELSMSDFSNNPYRNSRRQELNTNYRENGAIYIVKAKDIMDTKHDIYEKGCYAYIMETEKSIDIDTEMDFLLAETIKRYNRKDD